MITEDYVSFETAKLLKEKGFPQLKESEDEKLREQVVPVSEDLEKISYYFACMCHPLETAYSKTSPNPDIIKAFKAGAKWQKQQLMAKAIDAEVKVDAGGYPYIDKTIELYDYDKDVPLAKAGDKYKVVLIKED